MFVAFFSQFPDFFHIGELRMFSHSLVGYSAHMAIALTVLWILFRPRPHLVALAVLASFSHLMADLYIGSITPFYPWSNDWIEFHEFNSALDLHLELVLPMVVLMILILFNPLRTILSTLDYSKAMRRNLLLLAIPFTLLTML